MNKPSKDFSFAQMAINRPVFITCILLLIIISGYLSIKKIPVDLFPDVTFPVITVITPYPGAGPKEVETLLSKIFEQEFATISGVKALRSINQEGTSIVVTEFNFSTDIRFAEQQIRDKIAAAKPKLPKDVLDSKIRRIDPSDQPVITLALDATLSSADLYDLADLEIRPMLEQVNQVGLVKILGGQQREIKVELDLERMYFRQVSALQVVDALSSSGKNIPSGKVATGAKQETVFRTLGEFQNLEEISNTVVSFYGNDVATTISDVGTVKDDLKDILNLTYVNGKQSLILEVYRQTGSNTVDVAQNILKKVEQLNTKIAQGKKSGKLSIIRDGSKPIKDNIFDVKESIYIGIILTIIVVFFFLGSIRSTIITGMALPCSLLGAFIFVWMAGFSINVMTLLALSLAVGLLIDDAIVVRENIFRHLEMGKSPRLAALDGTKEVMLAVLATTLTVVAVFGPIAFLDGVVGQFFKQFGLTVCFALIISFFDAITVAPMMSAYFAGKMPTKENLKKSFFNDKIINPLIDNFNVAYQRVEQYYVSILPKVLKNPLKVLAMGAVLFILSIVSLKFVPKTFMAAQDQGEFLIKMDFPSGTTLDETQRMALDINKTLLAHKEVSIAQLTIGTEQGESNKAVFYVRLVPTKERKINTIQFKELIRNEMKKVSGANIYVSDFDNIGSGERPFRLNIYGDNELQLQEMTAKIFERIKNTPALKDVDMSYRPGKPEFQIIPEKKMIEELGISTNTIGQELRTLVEGQTPAVYRVNGEQYDVRVRLKEDQRNLKKEFDRLLIPNTNNRMVPLKQIVTTTDIIGPASITREDRTRYFAINADIAPEGPGMGGAIAEINKIFKEEIILPPGMGYKFVGQAESFQELVVNMAIAAALAVLFIYFVLASLYESFVIPFSIMLVLPLAACGAFFALAITGVSLDLFSMIGCVMLLGVATKNSIILVDYIKQKVEEGFGVNEAINLAAKNRLRPILMTSFALIAGMIPIALGLNEASKQRTSMGIALIGGLISSTLLTLVIIPAAYTYIHRLNEWIKNKAKKVMTIKEGEAP